MQAKHGNNQLEMPLLLNWEAPAPQPAPVITPEEIEKIVRVAHAYKAKNPWADLDDLRQQAYVIIFETWERYKDRIDPEQGVVSYMRRVVDNGLRDYVMKDKAPCSIPKRTTKEWFWKHCLHRAGARVSATEALDDNASDNPAVRAMFAKVRVRIYEQLPQETTEESTAGTSWDLRVRERLIDLIEESVASPALAAAAEAVLIHEMEIAEAAALYQIEEGIVKVRILKATHAMREDPILRRLMAERGPHRQEARQERIEIEKREERAAKKALKPFKVRAQKAVREAKKILAPQTKKTNHDKRRQ